jgi:hypothetical protein
MELQRIKWSVSAAWVFVAVIVGLVAGVASSGGLVTLAALGLLPPLALLLLWNEPPQTMSETISRGRHD